MDRGYFINLTNELYRLTLLFPKKEPLRYKMRELADEILSKFHKKYSDDILEKLEILDSFFEVAKAQNWVSPSELLEIQEEYSKIKKEAEKIVKAEEIKKKKLQEGKSPTSTAPVSENQKKILDYNLPLPPQIFFKNLGEQATRQEKILEFLREKGRAQVWELKKIFPEITKRTLRRDFEQLLRKELIERKGEKNETFYQLKLS